MPDPFAFELVSPERQVLSGEAASVVVPGTDGEFTVLKNHAPLISTLKPGILEVELAGGEKHSIFVRGGFADTGAGGLIVLAEEATPLADLDMAKLSEAISDAEDDVRDASDDDARQVAGEQLARLQEVRDTLNARGA